MRTTRLPAPPPRPALAGPRRPRPVDRLRRLPRGRRRRPRHLGRERPGPPHPAPVDRHRQRRQPRDRPARLRRLAQLRQGQADRRRLDDDGPELQHAARARRTTSSPSWPGGDANSVVMLGAHLDSVGNGAGINDNGSGRPGSSRPPWPTPRAARAPRNKVRVGFWGAEELGLLGSKHYMSSLSDDGEGQDRALPQLRHDRLAQPRLLRLRRQPGRQRRPRRDDRLVHVQGHPVGVHRRPGAQRPRRLPVLRHRDRPASSAVRRSARRAPRRRSGAARPTRPSTPATTPRATPPRTSTRPRSTGAPTSSGTCCGPTPPRTSVARRRRPPGATCSRTPGSSPARRCWTGTAGPITNNTGRPARTGSWKAWLGGNGSVGHRDDQPVGGHPGLGHRGDAVVLAAHRHRRERLHGLRHDARPGRRRLDRHHARDVLQRRGERDVHAEVVQPHGLQGQDGDDPVHDDRGLEPADVLRRRRHRRSRRAEADPGEPFTDSPGPVSPEHATHGRLLQHDGGAVGDTASPSRSDACPTD